MSDPLRKVSPGEPVRPSARLHNDLADLVAAWKAGRLGATSAAAAAGRPPALEVLVRNDTGADQDAGAVLATGDAVVDYLTLPYDVRRRPVFAADTPAATTDRFVILSEPIPDGQIGSGVLLGVAVTRVTGTGSYATPTVGQLYLTAGSSGPCRVWLSDSGSSLRDAVVVLGGGVGVSDWFPARVVTVGDTEADGYTVLPVELDPDTKTFEPVGDAEEDGLTAYRVESATATPPRIAVGQDVLCRLSPSSPDEYELAAHGGQYQRVTEEIVHVEPVCVDGVSYLDVYLKRFRKASREQCWTEPAVDEETTELGPPCSES